MRTDRLRRTKRILRILAGFVIALAVIYVSWSVWANLPPEVSIPPQKLPKPNGFDYYVQAEKKIYETQKKDKLYRIFDQPKHVILARDYPHGEPRLRAANHVDKEALLASLSDALAKAREGKKYHCVVPRKRGWIHGFREISQAFVLESIVHGENGDWRRAMESCLDLLEISSDLSLEYGTSGYQNLAYRRFWNVLPHVDQSATQEALLRVNAVTNSAVSFVDSTREDIIRTELLLLETFRQKDWRAVLESGYDCMCMETYTHDRERMICRFSSKRRIMKDWIATSKQIILNAKMPYRVMPANYPPKHEFFHLRFAGLDETRAIWETHNIRNNFIQIALALRAYQLKHHAYPSSLSQLVPGYLSKLPNDPFAPKGTFRYIKNGSNYLLYSLGSNCKDDGGKLIPTAGESEYCANYKDMVANPKTLVRRSHRIKSRTHPPSLPPR